MGLLFQSCGCLVIRRGEFVAMHSSNPDALFWGLLQRGVLTTVIHTAVSRNVEKLSLPVTIAVTCRPRVTDRLSSLAPQSCAGPSCGVAFRESIQFHVYLSRRWSVSAISHIFLTRCRQGDPDPGCSRNS